LGSLIIKKRCGVSGFMNTASVKKGLRSIEKMGEKKKGQKSKVLVRRKK